jgi:hypothetical protein
VNRFGRGNDNPNRHRPARLSTSAARARAVGITVEEARRALHWWLDQLEPLSERERDALVAKVAVLNHMLD